MELRDHDHDGRATEFVLPIGGVGCVYHHYVVVGISRREPKLYVFSDAGHPLELSYPAWEVLRSKKGRGRYVERSCGNHGSETQIEADIWVDEIGIHTKFRELSCREVLRRDGAIP